MSSRAPQPPPTRRKAKRTEAARRGQPWVKPGHEDRGLSIFTPSERPRRALASPRRRRRRRCLRRPRADLAFGAGDGEGVDAAASSRRSTRPDAPPCPASIAVRSRIGPPPVMSRSLAPISPAPRVAGDARIGQTVEREDRRIGLRPDVVVGGVGADRCEHLGRADGIAPFVPLGRGQRQVAVKHGVDHIDKRHFGDDAREKLRRD